MATLAMNSPFTSWDMTTKEVLAGCLLTLAQKQNIQNIIAAYATEKLQRDIDPINPIVSIQADAKASGQISALQYLLDLSAQAEEQLRSDVSGQNLNDR